MPGLPELPNWLTISLAGVLVCAVLLVAVQPQRRWTVAMVFVTASLLVVFDINRLQPWVYQYLILFAATSWSRQPLRVVVFVLGATYVWSGIQKLNPSFAHHIFPLVAHPLRLPDSLWIAAPLAEILTGVALLCPRFRAWGCLAACCIHTILLITLGPLGANVNRVIWPWNIFLPAIVVAACWKTKDKLWPDIWRDTFGKVAMLLVGLLPALSFLGLWDTYPSLGLYSGKAAEGFIFLSEEAANRVPENVSMYVQTSRGRKALDLVRWAMADLGAPPYPEPRVYRGVRDALERAGVPREGMRLVTVRP
jgi:uncharacterized membrane protein YphA (DoxX/SURF4 family)